MQDQVHRIAIRLHQLQLLKRVALQRMLPDDPLCRRQHTLLEFVERNPGCTQAQVAQKLLISAASVAQSTQRLERDGLLKRCTAQDNRRCNRLYITPQGSAALCCFRERLRSVDATMLKGFSGEEYTALEGYLERILKNIAFSAEVDLENMDRFAFFALAQKAENEENRKERGNA